MSIALSPALILRPFTQQKGFLTLLDTMNLSTAVPSKSAWARGPPRTILATSSSQQPPRPPGVTPGAATNPRSTHPRRSRAPAQGVSIQHGLSVPRSTSAAKPGASRARVHICTTWAVLTISGVSSHVRLDRRRPDAHSRVAAGVVAAVQGGLIRRQTARSPRQVHPSSPAPPHTCRKHRAHAGARLGAHGQRESACPLARVLARCGAEAPRAAPIAADVVPQGAGHAMPAEQLIPCVLEWDQHAPPHAEQGPSLPPRRNTASPSYAANATVRPSPSPRRLSAHATAFVPSEPMPSLEYRVHAGPAAVTRPLSAPRTPSALATARFIDDIEAIPYPAGVRRPLSALNRNAQKGKFRCVSASTPSLRALDSRTEPHLPVRRALQVRPRVPAAVRVAVRGHARRAAGGARRAPPRS